MTLGRILGSCVIGLCLAQMGRAQTYSLAETSRVGDCFQIHLEMKLAGEMDVSKDGKPATIKLAATAVHDFPERVLAVATNGAVQKVARAYQTANARIAIGSEVAVRTLRPERSLLVAQRHPDLVIYCPTGPLTRPELELTSELFDTLSLSGLLPGRALPGNQTWKVSNDAVQALCGFEGVTAQDLTCKLEEVKNDIARVSLKGTATGIDLGALVKLTIDGSYQFNLNAHRLVALEWRQQDERGQGPANPATKVETTTTLTRAVIAQPTGLSDVALISVPDGFDAPASLTQLLYHHESKPGFDMVYDRNWQIVGNTNGHLVMRLLDRGDFVAQVTITPWESAQVGHHMSPELFRSTMGKTPGWEQGEVVQEGEMPSESGRWIYRISAPGRMDGLKVVQNFFLIAGPDGQQVVVAFTMTPAQAEKLGTRDLALVGGIEFLHARKAENKKPS